MLGFITRWWGELRAVFRRRHSTIKATIEFDVLDSREPTEQEKQRGISRVILKTMLVSLGVVGKS